MQNAHLRMGRLEYSRITQKIETRIKVHLERYVGDGEQAHFFSVFGNDQEIGAVSAAIHEKHDFEVVMPDETRRRVSLKSDASTHRGTLTLKGKTKSLRHLLGVSSVLRGNGGGGQLILFNIDAQNRELAWATIVSQLGLPADPRWAGPVLESLYKDKMMRQIDGLNCSPFLLNCTKADLMKRLGSMLKTGQIPFPENNGPILWPGYSMRDVLSQITQSQANPVPAEVAA